MIKHIFCCWGVVHPKWTLTSLRRCAVCRKRCCTYAVWSNLLRIWNIQVSLVKRPSLSALTVASCFEVWISCWQNLYHSFSPVVNSHVCSWHGLVKVSLQICLIAWMNCGRRFFPNTWVLCSNVFKWVASRPLWILWLSRSFQPNLGWWSQKLNDNLLARMAQCLWVDFAELIPKVGEMFLLHWCAKSSSSVGWKTKLPSIKYHKLCIIGINLIDVKWCKA